LGRKKDFANRLIVGLELEETLLPKKQRRRCVLRQPFRKRNEGSTRKGRGMTSTELKGMAEEGGKASEGMSKTCGGGHVKLYIIKNWKQDWLHESRSGIASKGKY